MKSWKATLARCKGGILAALALCFIAVVYGPLELYFTNREDFWFAPNVILPDVIFLFLAAFALCIVLLLLAQKFSQKLYEILTACYVWGVLVCYIHSNFLSGWLPSMDGTAIDWNAYPKQRLLSIAVCAALLVLVVSLAKMKWLQKAALWGGAALSLMLLITVITLGIGSTSSAGSYYTSTTEGIRTYSKDKNFVIFVLDSVDGDTFEQLVKENPDYQGSLQDFTYYSNTLSAYPYTYYAVPQLLTGQWYEGGEDFERFRSRAVLESPLFQSLEEQNYKMGIYFAENLVDKNALPERFFNMRWEAPDIVSHPAFWRVILRMSCVKNAPYDFKRLGYCLPDKLNGLKKGDPLSQNTWFSSNNVRFLNYCQATEITDTPQKMFKYIHVDGAHAPYEYGPHLENVQETEQATYKNNVAASIYVIENYLNQLRQNGVYDNTAILIMSDHGTGIHLDGSETLEGRQHSIFLAKGFGEQHDYAVNEAPLSYADLQTVYQRILNGNSSDELIDYQAGDQRDRRFLEATDDGVLVEKIQKGAAGDFDTIEATGNIYKIAKSIGE